MSKLRTPYQCLKQCGNYLIAARGSSIDTFDIKDGSYLSTWKSPVPESMKESKTTGEEIQTESEEQNLEKSTPDVILESSTPPAKRRKLSVGEGTEEKTVVVQQVKKKAKSNPSPKIIEPSPITALTITRDLQHVIIFEHKLLLGHVSMLTDILVAAVSGRQYILTADRDEHIRVSRGIPQAHVIEGSASVTLNMFSRLCIPSTRPEILISGGGDDDLHIWNWKPKDEQEAESKKVSVTGIYHAKDETSNQDIIIATSEGVRQRLFTLSHLPTNSHIPKPSKLPGNALSCTLSNPTPSSQFSLTISIDNVHEKGSITTVKDANSPIPAPAPLQFFKYHNGQFIGVEHDGFVITG
ncbi:hypothetical protein DID88_007717 [Monilinia fructigena]|uniref:tRNA (guanine-N(7)-)-methyltransferase non-catalytic subunit TRM82 n=1 Tax=Monilinia fructigena TaxID=38457 RepID=A0A395J349_9HELO|nr:hypothetical protein DID88_007717 [Monilinia fructigena]